MAQTIGYYKHLTGNGGFPLQGRFLMAVTVNTKGTTSTLTVYDGTDATGTVIAVIDTGTALGTFLYDILAAVNSALFVVAAGAVAADLTIASY